MYPFHQDAFYISFLFVRALMSWKWNVL